ncbi:MAG TPA: 7-cyano-7-deazaguanine synthase QueC [Candidatus Sumerlaeota bacterium]|nr:MAG: 7-cyano-7-deazaguanine synthase [candidate division BRC1 bacterium ADurb.Bin183]HOE63500.1 7-cyano-7-deazaguanine synthase QueC [Candidatus Sumerlaeota bacterium]HRR31449.1 7-cyano-7-deazaguanine synthase QueC [Candidatus Sumerlaeia bacterium]HON51385.1 7-cyano-7-deazaguanine synthase QueC [Candidatus Sumerlaeota bacterium]HOR64562.1 7-cyano-7-deazaguanine synthase QueC [Candidatus Sumerlaeota bacterium]
MTDLSANNPHGIVLVSGGMDSCVTAAIALNEGAAAFLHVDYSQRTEARERLAFHQIADYYKIPSFFRKVITLDYLRSICCSALTDDSIPVPKFEKLEEEGNGEIPITYVPFRNAHILCMAVSWAETIGARRIYIGAVAGDSAGYPDCRPEFYEAFNKLVEVGSKAGRSLKVAAPLIKMSKKEIVQKGRELNAPLHLTWSCYEQSEKACGRCDSCLRRLRAFQEAGVVDPIPYENI